MILDAKLLTTLQICPRRFLLESDWEVLKWRPKSLFDASLRKSIQSISQGGNAKDIAGAAKADYLQSAANPGLDLPRGSNPYQIAKDYCAMIDTILRSAAHWGLPALGDSPVVHLNSTTGWRPLSFTGPDGSLHRIVTVDRWGAADLSRELHGWGVFGDVAATDRSMTLHVVEIGQTRNGRRASAWARAWRHPAMRNLKLRFLRKDGSSFKGWLPHYLSDDSAIDCDEWVAQMEREGVAGGLVHRVQVDPLDPAVREDTLGQILLESRRGDVLLSERRSSSWKMIPMYRASCDGMIPCPFQPACHQSVTDPGELGLYRINSGVMLSVA